MISQRNPDETGTSLVELMVVMLLLSIVAVIMFSFLWSVVNTTTRATSNTEAEKAITLALRPLTENVRSASTISTTYPSTSSCPAGTYPSGYTNCLSFTIGRPSPGALTCPKSVVVYGLKSDGILREDRTDYKLVSGVCSVAFSYQARPLLKNISNGATPLFTYFDAFGNKLDPAAGGQTTTPFKNAVTVRVSVSDRYRLGAPLLSYTSDLAVRNNR
jgi:type II secretory pathway pseudopilin PulG